jgi:diacylglycerol kinase family enzyme
MSRYLLLVNRASGGNDRGLDAAEVCQSAERIFRDAGHEITSAAIEPERIESEIEKAIQTGIDGLIIAGGDGTVSTAARLLGGTGIALGVLPMGTFNLAARDLGVPLEMENAAKFLAAADSFPIDVLDVSGHACLCTTILGFYPEFAGIFERRDHGGHWWKKSWRLLTGLPRIFARARPLPISWSANGQTGRAKTKFTAFVPGRYRPTAGVVPARTDFRSGTMTAYIGTQKSSAAALRGMLDYILGRQEQNPDLQILKAESIVLRSVRRHHCTVMLDGEILRLKFPIQFRILPGHLRVLSTEANLTDQPPQKG